jgi:DNA-binding response OmpR family regulator
VLAVDDDRMILELLTEFLVSEGHAVVTAQSASAALLLVARASPDVVLLDIKMAGVDGMTALRRIRSRHPTVPVIMLTANDDVDLARDTLKFGAFDYVAKPFDFGHLARVIEAAVAHRGDEDSTALS